MPILALSSRGGEESIAAALTAGADDFVHAPTAKERGKPIKL